MKSKNALFSIPKAKPKPEPETVPLRKKIGAAIVKGIKRICMTIGALFLIFYIGIAIAWFALPSGTTAKALPDEMVLYFRVDEGVREQSVKPSITDPFPAQSLTMSQLVIALDRAERDERVKGLVLSLHGQSLSVTQIQELRHSIKQLKAAGKFTYVIAADYGAGGGVGDYYLASVFDEVWMHPVGVVSMSGLSMETPYVKNVLDKLGITPQFYQRKEFKSAFESFTSEEMSKENRLAMQAVVDSLGDQITSGIANGRGVSQDDVLGYMETALMPAPYALEANLVDGLGYGSDLFEHIKATHNFNDLSLVYLDKYAGRAMSKPEGQADVAYIHIDGTLTLAPDPYGEDYSDSSLLMTGSDTAAAIDAAVQSGVKAIVLRVDSPGGTPAAAEVIRHAVVKAQKADVKVYVSMASVAASGGYWLSAPADKIFALPGTLTGSIGVVGGKVTIQDMADKLDINIERVQYGNNPGFWSLTEPFTKEQAARFEAMLDVTYDNFINVVAQGRGLTFEEAEARAKGRVWTGEQALENGLIDGYGGLGGTLDALAKDMGFEAQKDITLVQFPKPKSRYEAIMDFLEEQAVFMGVMAQFAPMLERIGVYMDATPIEAGVHVHSGLDGV